MYLDKSMCDIVKGATSPWLRCVLEVKLHEKDGPVQNYIYSCQEVSDDFLQSDTSLFTSKTRSHQALQCFPESILIPQDSDSQFTYHYLPSVGDVCAPLTPYFPTKKIVNEQSMFCYCFYTSRSDKNASRGHVLTSYVQCSTIYQPNAFQPMISVFGRLCGMYGIQTITSTFVDNLSTYDSLIGTTIVLYRVPEWSIQQSLPCVYIPAYTQFDELCTFAGLPSLSELILPTQPMCIDLALGSSLRSHVYTLWSMQLLHYPISLALPYINSSTMLLHALSTLTYPFPPPRYQQPCTTTNSHLHDHTKGGQQSFRNSILTKIVHFKNIILPSSTDSVVCIDQYTKVHVREVIHSRQTKFIQTEFEEMFPSMYPVYNMTDVSSMGSARVEVEKQESKRQEIVTKFLDKCDVIANKKGGQYQHTPKPMLVQESLTPGIQPKVKSDHMNEIPNLSIHMSQVTSIFIQAITRYMCPPSDLFAFPQPSYRIPDIPEYEFADLYHAIVGGGVCTQQSQQTSISSKRWASFIDAFLHSNSGKNWFLALKDFIRTCGMAACEKGLLVPQDTQVIIELAETCEVDVLERAIRKGREYEHTFSHSTQSLLQKHMTIYRDVQLQAHMRKWTPCHEQTTCFQSEAHKRQIEVPAEWEPYITPTTTIPGKEWEVLPKDQPSPNSPTKTVRNSLVSAWTQIQGHFDEAFK